MRLNKAIVIVSLIGIKHKLNKFYVCTCRETLKGSCNVTTSVGDVCMVMEQHTNKIANKQTNRHRNKADFVIPNVYPPRAYSVQCTLRKGAGHPVGCRTPLPVPAVC